MTIPGRLIRITGSVVGNTVEYGIKFTGELIGYIAETKGNGNLARQSRKIGKITGSLIGGTTRFTSRILGNAVDRVVETGSEGMRYVTENAVRTETRIYGESDNFYEPSAFVEAEYKVE